MKCASAAGDGGPNVSSSEHPLEKSAIVENVLQLNMRFSSELLQLGVSWRQVLKLLLFLKHIRQTNGFLLDVL